MIADIVTVVVHVVGVVGHSLSVVNKRLADNTTAGRLKDNYLAVAHDTWNKKMC